MNKKLSKLASLAMGVVMCGSMFAVTGCNKQPDNPSGGLTGEYNITMWVSNSEGVRELTEKQVAQFNADNAANGLKINATIEAVGENDAATKMITDVKTGADIYCFSQDQLGRLVQAKALNALGKKATEEVTARDSVGSVNASTIDGKMYCYPLTDDNGYFLYYDKSVVSESSISSLEAIVADCEAAKKYFAMETAGSAWYIASWFFATGCISTWDMDNAGTFTGVEDTFNSDAGLIAMRGMQHLVQSPYYKDSSSAAELNSGAAVLVSGVWAYNDVKKALGDNMGVAELPSFTVDGKSYHLGSFSGNKLMGVKPSDDANKNAALHSLARYLTSETCQMERYNAVAWGPSNKNAQNSEAVKANPALYALTQQNVFATAQGNIHGSWWSIASNLGTVALNAGKDDATALKKGLQDYENAIKGCIAQ